MMSKLQKTATFFLSCPIGKNPGATNRQIGHNSIFTITKEAPKALVAGANDILYKSTNGNVPNEVTIVNDIISVGKQAVDRGVERVYISSIIVMSTPQLIMYTLFRRGI